MAIDKKSIQSGRKCLKETPIHCPEHQAAPDPECGHREHCCVAPEIKLYTSFEEAVIAASKVYLRPGEARSEFYKDSSTEAYHCVLAIGNINAAKGHIVLTDTGNDKPYHEQYEYLKDLIDLNSNILSQTVTTVNTKLAAFDSSINAMRTEMNTFMTSVNTIVNEFREEISGDIDDIRAWVDASLGAFRTEMSNWTVSLQSQMTALSEDVSSRMAATDMRVADVSARLTSEAQRLDDRISAEDASCREREAVLNSRIEAVIANTSILDASTNERIDNIRLDVSEEIAAAAGILNARIETVIANTSVMDETTNLRIDNLIEDCSVRCSSINERITTEVERLDTRITDGDASLNSRIESVIANTSILNDATNERIDDLIEDCSVRCSSINERITTEVERLDTRITDGDASVNTRIDGVITVMNMMDISNLQRFGNIESHMSVTDASIADLFCLVSEPITDPSILSLFDKDIYTVNLCCYTEGGYVIIRDEKEPIGQYKTYVTGDKVEFTAVPNVGYKFKKWMRNAVDYTTDTSIGLTFHKRDINVNGLLPTDDIAILKDGYSAIFAALYTVTTHCIVETNHAEMFNDNIQVRGAIQGKWFDDGMEIELIANPQQHHDFKRFVINGTQSLLPDVRLTPNANIDAYAYFTERRYTIVGESHDILQGDVTYTYRDEAGNPYSGMVENEVIEGTKVTLTATPVQGYRFVKWTYGQGESKYGELYDDQHASVTIVASATCVKRLEAWFEADV